MTLRKFYSPQVLFFTEHLASCSVDSSGSNYVYLDYTELNDVKGKGLIC